MTDQRLIAHVIIPWKGRRQTKNNIVFYRHDRPAPHRARHYTLERSPADQENIISDNNIVFYRHDRPAPHRARHYSLERSPADQEQYSILQT
jgi:hypothetical protein